MAIRSSKSRSAPPHRRQGLTLVAFAAFPAALFLVTAFVVKPPTAGWIGVAIVALVWVALVAAMTGLFQRTRANPVPVPRLDDGVRRLLVLADVRSPWGQLCHEVTAHLRDRPARVLVVAPIIASRLQFLAGSEEQETVEARERLDEALAALGSAGISATGVIGTDDPLQAIADALGDFPANEILIVTSEPGHEAWLERGLKAQARQLFRIPVTCVASAAPVGPAR